MNFAIIIGGDELANRYIGTYGVVKDQFDDKTILEIAAKVGKLAAVTITLKNNTLNFL